MKKIQELHHHFLQSTGICTDTRKITPGCLFFALRGDHFDGNKFADEALRKGAYKVVIDSIQYHRNTGETILFGNALKALQKLARYHRQHLALPILALTGSNGKTTTKELIHAVLSRKFNTVATDGNLNNHIGVPLTLLSMHATTQMGIVEMGANHLQEIDALCEIALPDYGYISNFGKAHLEGFGSLEGVVMGKTELYRHIKKQGKVVFVNGNDTKQIKYSKGIHRYTFGNAQQNCTVQLKETTGPVLVTYKGMSIQSQLIGLYNFHNIAASIAVGDYFGVAPGAIKAAIEEYIPKNNRSQRITQGSNHIILDAYNANPSSMMAALEYFKKTDGNSKIMFLGDMFELGNEAVKEHQTIVNFLEEDAFGTAVLIGSNFYTSKVSANHIQQFENFETFSGYLKENRPENSTLLIKGSRGMALERILELI